jgi:TPR repeat protein
MEPNLTRHRQSLNDITKMLREQHAVLAQQSTIAMRSWSIAELSDSETVVAEGSTSRVSLFDDLPINPTAYPGSPPLARHGSQEANTENLINLDDDHGATPSNGSSDPHVRSANLEDMRGLNPTFFKGKGTRADEDTSKIVCEVERGVSPQSISTLPCVIVDSEEKIVVPTGSLHERHPSGSSATTPCRVSEQSAASFQELQSRDSIGSSLPEVIMTSNEFFPKVVNPHAYLPPLEQDVEANLESRLPSVQNSHDHGLQLNWAEEVLQFIGSDAARRNSAMKKQVASPTKSPSTADNLHIEAKTIVESLAHKGYPKAMFLKARWIEPDPQLILRDYLNALARGYSRAAYYVGTSYEQDKKNHKTAIGYYKQGCDGGDSASRGRMALAYLRGELGLKRNVEDAIRLLLQAAATADSDAPDSLSVLAKLQTPNYRRVLKIKEKLLPVDIRAARENLFKAAKLGDAIAQITLGQAYTKPDNELQVPVDAALSLHYLRLASRHGMPEADLQISSWFWFGHSVNGAVIVPENPVLAFRYAYRAMKNDYTPAFCQVGFFYERGLGVKQNFEKAKDCYVQAISRGDQDARKRYDAFINKLGVERRQKEKETLMRKSTGMSAET